MRVLLHTIRVTVRASSYACPRTAVPVNS